MYFQSSVQFPNIADSSSNVSDHVVDAIVAEVVFATKHAFPLLFYCRGLLDHQCSMHRGSFVVEVAIQSLFDYVYLLLELIDRDFEINSI